jgi:hypothetical protein
MSNEPNPFEQEIEDLIANHEAAKQKKKKVNSGDKGDRAERNLCKLLSARFHGLPFSRTSGSGNYWARGIELTESAKDCLVGDLVGPDNFGFVIESKCGYEKEVDFHSLFLKGNSKLNEFFDQVTADSNRSGKKPLLVYKRNLRQWLAFVPTSLLPEGMTFDYQLIYREWTGVALERLLEAPDAYFFKEDK